jgi:small-conductance mechanosensitive channel
VSASVVDGIQSLVPLPGGAAVASVVALVALAAAAYLVWIAGPRLKSRLDNRLVEVLQALAIVVLTVATGWFIVVAWQATAEVNRAINLLDLGYGTVVRAVISVLVAIVAFSLTVLAKRLIAEVSERNRAFSSHQRQVGFHIVQIGIYVLATLVILALWDVRIGDVLIGAGALGIILGLAARQTLAAVLAGFVLLFSRPFDIGDWVEIDEIEGTITDVTIFNTQIQTLDDEDVMIPNDVVTSHHVVNRSRRDRLRVTVDVGVDYDADVDRAAEVAAEAMSGLEELRSQPEPQVVYKSFGDSAVVLQLRFWIDNPSARRMWEAKTAVVGAVKEAFEEAGIQIPFPQRALSGRQGFASEGQVVATGERDASENGQGSGGESEGDEATAEDD